MTGAALLDRVAAAGAVASLEPDGRMRIAGVSRLPTGLLDLLRQNRTEIGEALTARRGDAPATAADEASVPQENPDDAAEQAAMAGQYAAPSDASPWRPSDPDPLRDGLLAGWRASRFARLAADRNSFARAGDHGP